jgi:hypothetical protein
MRETVVFHREYGRGAVVDAGAGAVCEVNVDFGYMKKRCSTHDLYQDADYTQCVAEAQALSPDGTPGMASNRRSSVTPTPIPGSQQPARSDLGATSWRDDDRATAVQGLIALRLGQVLEHHVLDLTVGAEEVEASFEAAIAEAIERRPQLLLVDGPWGGGKTHALTLLQALAHQNGMATAYVVLDGRAVTLTEPNELLGAVLREIRFKDDSVPVGVGVRVLDVVRNHRASRLRSAGAPNLCAALEQIVPATMDDPDVADTFEDYLVGTLAASHAKRKLRDLTRRSVKLPSIKAQRLADRAPRFVARLVEWSRFVAATGDKGLVVVLDELDVDYAFNQRGGERVALGRGMRRDLLRGLAQLAKRHTAVPLIVAFGSAPASSEVAREYDAVNDVIDALDGAYEDVEVPVLDKKDLRVLFDRLLALYRVAHPSPTLVGSPARAFDGLWRDYQRQLNPVPRYLVRLAVELLDVASTCGDPNIATAAKRL